MHVRRKVVSTPLPVSVRCGRAGLIAHCFLFYLQDTAAGGLKIKGKMDMNSVISDLHALRHQHGFITDKFIEMERWVYEWDM